MSQQLISRSPDLKRLQDDGYGVHIRAGYLLLSGVPYVDADRAVRHGTLVSTLDLSGEITTRPSTHVAMFGRGIPCDADGNTLHTVINAIGSQVLADGVTIDVTFSQKPAAGYYTDYYEKMVTYAAILTSEAVRIDPNATAQTYPVVEDTDGDSVFRYTDTASSRAGIQAVAEKLRLGPTAIVGARRHGCLHPGPVRENAGQSDPSA